MIKLPRMSHVLIGASWLGAAVSLVPVVNALRGDFRVEAPGVPAHGQLVPLEPSASPIRLDTATMTILVYSATCPACKANTDNWLRLRAELRARQPTHPVVVIPAPQGPTGRPELPAALRVAFPEYRLESATMRDLGVSVVPATVLVKRGRVVSITSGIIGPQRRDRFVADVQTEGR